LRVYWRMICVRFASMVTAALRRFRDHAASIETRSPFDRRSVPAYLMIGTLVAASVAVSAVFGFTVDPALRSTISGTLLFFLLTAYLARRIGLDRLAGWFETMALLGLSGAAGMIVLCALTVLSGPYADAILARADAALGFHWINAAQWLAARPSLTNVAIAVYHSFSWQPPIVLGILFLTGRGERAWKLTNAGLIALLVCLTIFPFAPAAGPFFRSGARLADFGALADTGAYQSGTVIHFVKDGGRRLIDRSFRGGLISIPSYHVAAATIFAWALWPTRTRWIFLLLNFGVTVAAIVVGNHYFVDVLAGIAVGVVSIWIAGAMGVILLLKG